MSIDEYGVVAQKDKVELSTDNDEVTALDYIPTTNCDGAYNDNGVFIFYYAKEGFLLSKQILSPYRMKLVLMLTMKWEELH